MHGIVVTEAIATKGDDKGWELREQRVYRLGQLPELAPLLEWGGDERATDSGVMQEKQVLPVLAPEQPTEGDGDDEQPP